MNCNEGPFQSYEMIKKKDINFKQENKFYNSKRRLKSNKKLPSNY